MRTWIILVPCWLLADSNTRAWGRWLVWVSGREESPVGLPLAGKGVLRRPCGQRGLEVTAEQQRLLSLDQNEAV